MREKETELGGERGRETREDDVIKTIIKVINLQCRSCLWPERSQTPLPRYPE